MSRRPGTLGLGVGRLAAAAGSLLSLLSEALLPPECYGCGGTGSAPLCRGCAAALETLWAPALLSPDPGGGGAGLARVGDRVRAPVLSAFLYRGLLRRLVLGLKFGGAAVLAEPLGSYLARAALSRLPPSSSSLVSWVPLGKSRAEMRGYDQAGLLARWAAAGLGLPAVPTLERVRETLPQSGLGAKERGRNVCGCFALHPRCRALPGTRVLLVDDVVTTGATAAEAAAVLGRAGFDVVVMALAVAPLSAGGRHLAPVDRGKPGKHIPRPL